MSSTKSSVKAAKLAEGMKSAKSSSSSSSKDVEKQPASDDEDYLKVDGKSKDVKAELVKLSSVGGWYGFDATERFPRLGTHAAMMSGIRAHATKVVESKTRKGHGRGTRGDVYHIPITIGFDFVTTSGGVGQYFLSGPNIAVASDWSALINLFDIVRCPAIRWQWEPRAAFSQGISSIVHEPIMACGDDDAVTSITFATLIARDLMDKRNHFFNTQRAARGYFNLKKAFNTVATSPTASKPTLPVWMDTSLMAIAGGGLLVSCRTDTANVSQVLGVMRVCYLLEWSTQL